MCYPRAVNSLIWHEMQNLIRCIVEPKVSIHSIRSYLGLFLRFSQGDMNTLKSIIVYLFQNRNSRLHKVINMVTKELSW